MQKPKDVKKNVQFLEEYLQEKNISLLHPYDIAKALINLKKLDNEEFIKYLKLVPDDILGDVVLEFPENYLKDVLQEIPSIKLARAVEELESDDATDLLLDIEDINEEKAEEILSNLDEKDQEDIKKLRRYEEDQAGAYMQTEVFEAKYDEKIQSAIDRLRKNKEEGDLENIHQVFITGTYDRLLLSISLEDLITFDFSKTFRDILGGKEEEYKPIYVKDDEEIDDISQMFEEYDLSVAPVVDYHGKLLGRITSDDIYDVIQENATEQIFNLAGVDDEAEVEENILKSGQTRAAWLSLNLITAIIASVVIGFFDETIKNFVPLAILMPIVASMGGNAGTQTLTVVVRRLALGEIELSNTMGVIKKEIYLSLFNGFVFAVVVGVVAFFWFDTALLGFVIAASMVINIFFAGFFGAVIPLLLKRADVDPAVGSTVLLTTVTDVVGFFSFLALAKVVLVV